MKIEDAKKISGLLDDLKSIKKNRHGVNSTKEFCNIEMYGEDGAEHRNKIQFSHKVDPELIKRIRDVIYKYLDEKEEATNKKIETI